MGWTDAQLPRCFCAGTAPWTFKRYMSHPAKQQRLKADTHVPAGNPDQADPLHSCCPGAWTRVGGYDAVTR